MGHTLKQLSSAKLEGKRIFDNRFVTEVCEQIHFHYRNLRVNLSLSDWEQMSKGMVDAYERWKKLGEPPTGKTHVELCRKSVALFPHNDGIQVNLNQNLYHENSGKIYAEGAGLKDQEYIHLKFGDLRLEFTTEEFLKLADCVAEAKEKLNVVS